MNITTLEIQKDIIQSVCDCAPAIKLIFQKTEIFIYLMFAVTCLLIISAFIQKAGYITREQYIEYIQKPAIIVYIGGSAFLFSYLVGV